MYVKNNNCYIAYFYGDFDLKVNFEKTTLQNRKNQQPSSGTQNTDLTVKADVLVQKSN